MESEVDSDGHRFEVELWIAGDGRHIAAARAVAATLGADAGFDLDQIDDLRIALSEAVGVALDGPTPTPKLHIGFDASDHRVTIVVTRSDGRELSSLDQLAERILASVVDEVTATGSRIVLAKSRPQSG